MTDYDFYKNIGICPDCRKRESEPNRVFCFECAEKRKRRSALHYVPRSINTTAEKRKKDGICVQCGQRKAMKNRVRCGICLEKNRMKQWERRGKPIARNERKEYGACYICGAESEDILCERCRKRASRNIIIGRMRQKLEG